MSSFDDRLSVASALHLGAADYLVKPLRSNELMMVWTHVWHAPLWACVNPASGRCGCTLRLGRSPPDPGNRRQRHRDALPIAPPDLRALVADVGGPSTEDNDDKGACRASNAVARAGCAVPSMHSHVPPSWRVEAHFSPLGPY